MPVRIKILNKIFRNSQKILLMTKIKNMEKMILKLEKEIMSRKEGDWRGKKGLEVDQGVILEQVRGF